MKNIFRPLRDMLRSSFAFRVSTMVISAVAITLVVVNCAFLVHFNIGMEDVKTIRLLVSDTDKFTEVHIDAKSDFKEELALDDSTENDLMEDKTEGEAATESNETIAGIEELDTQQVTEEQINTELDTENKEEIEFPYYIKVNRMANCITVYKIDDAGEYTTPVKAMVCSTGRNNRTPLGVFTTSTKYTWRQLFGGVYGQYAFRVYGGVLFHSVPYYSKNKGKLETNQYNKLGEQASLGCIRLTVADAKWLVDNCPSGTKVEVYEEKDPGPLGKPEAVKLDTSDERSGWDPTDPDEENPWNVDDV